MVAFSTFSVHSSTNNPTHFKRTISFITDPLLAVSPLLQKGGLVCPEHLCMFCVVLFQSACLGPFVCLELVPDPLHFQRLSFCSSFSVFSSSEVSSDTHIVLCCSPPPFFFLLPRKEPRVGMNITLQFDNFISAVLKHRAESNQCSARLPNFIYYKKQTKAMSAVVTVTGHAISIC